LYGITLVEATGEEQVIAIKAPADHILHSPGDRPLPTLGLQLVMVKYGKNRIFTRYLQRAVNYVFDGP
jgi:hypothetical protein